MKLRIRANTLRLRLMRAEVEQLLATGETGESMPALGGVLAYAFALGDGDAATAELKTGAHGVELRVTWPRAEATAWAQDPREVGMRATVALSAMGTAAAGELALLVEKDFPCLIVREGEDDSDAFARPEDLPPQTC
jgi:hypothetical protein